jgi:hypothetical protein
MGAVVVKDNAGGWSVEWYDGPEGGYYFLSSDVRTVSQAVADVLDFFGDLIGDDDVAVDYGLGF